MDEVIRFGDVRMPATRLSDTLWHEQMSRWPIEKRRIA
jgi:hypothetical protein